MAERRDHIPFQSASFYGKNGEDISILIGLYQPIEQFIGAYDQILIKADRNIDYNAVINKNINIRRSSNPTSEYTFPSETGLELQHFELSQNDCRDFVIKNVTTCLKNEMTINPTKKIVLGVSGGGDSNTLILSFLESGLVQKDQLVGVMMQGIPDWDKGRSRAEAICHEHDIEFRVIDKTKVNELLGRGKEGCWVEDFEKVFPDADLEVLGTHCIRLALKFVAQEMSAQAIVIGVNLEDILAECFLATTRGQLPPPFPVRKIDGFSFWYPLYKIPKKIIDGCYPKFSLQNYNERYPSRMLGRAVPYYLSQSIHTLLPGAEFDLINGFKQLSKLNQSFAVFDEELGFTVIDAIHEELRKKWNQFIKNS